MMKDVLCGSQPFCLNVDDIVVNDEKLLTHLCLIVLVIFTSNKKGGFEESLECCFNSPAVLRPKKQACVSIM